MNWSNEQFCRRCNCDLAYAYQFQNNYNNYEEEKPKMSKAWLIWLIVPVVFVGVLVLAFGMPKEKKKIVYNSSPEELKKPMQELKKPINQSGERIDYKQFMVEGKTNIVYFYADW
jgi:cytochrome oxidase Cu insertion factor (SCO1/SenC/PrrC family)